MASQSQIKNRTKQSAGVLLFRRVSENVEVLLAHPGGPYWAKKDDHAWTIPKGEFGPEDQEDIWQAAQREFAEETGGTITGVPLPLAPVKQTGGKTVHAFAVEQDFDPTGAVSNTFTMEWPPKSGQVKSYPEIDRVAWFSLEAARAKMMRGQLPLLDELAALLNLTPPPG